jgi:hypothetical protein
MSSLFGSSWRNWTLGVLYLVTCIWLAYLSPSDGIKDLGPLFVQIGLGVVGIVAGRAANKWAERKTGGGQ